MGGRAKRRRVRVVVVVKMVETRSEGYINIVLFQIVASLLIVVVISHLDLRPLHISVRIRRTLAKVVHPLPQARRSGVLLGDAHGVAVELHREVGAEGEALGEG